MTRKFIQPEKGAIAPTIRDLWDAAREKLGEAETALAEMNAARDRVSYEAAWSQFVDSIEEFWCRFFDEGKTAFTNFQPWAGAIDQERKDDETLQYFYQARHQSQHGRIPMAWEEPQLIIGRGFAGRMYGLRIHPDGSYEPQAEPNNPAGQSLLVEHAPGKPVLPTIENKRHKQNFPAPSTHSGNPIADRSPNAVARLVLDYYERVMNQAVTKFVGESDA
ncbi:hypothetical protein D3879_10085 [Pseudomonas cavernicola]|uniref:Uncharacterized protein n=1 Tax=Pseudomonas cavernicola TaxID=2320866 RepID=A0A418XM90_9PSED|nr:hypothetical protein [Pseudomonas cavernicola]RJG13561.1 hypothetical protein D3879_10085 [Pseudomonas cavernicola]